MRTKILVGLVLGVVLMASVAMAATLNPVQDLNNLPSTATAGDTCVVTLLGRQMTYTSTGFWYPSDLTAPASAVTYRSGVQKYEQLPTTDANNTCRAVFSISKIYKYNSTTKAWTVLEEGAAAAYIIVPFGTGSNPSGAPLGSLYFRTDTRAFYVMIGVGQAGADANGWFNLKNAQYSE